METWMFLFMVIVIPVGLIIWKQPTEEVDYSEEMEEIENVWND